MESAFIALLVAVAGYVLVATLAAVFVIWLIVRNFGI